jgi:hypothetical protein
MDSFNFDPSVLISPPFIKCPKCGENSFGILMICAHHYCRRCKTCLFPGGNEGPALFPLPPLQKKVVYLDQFAISNMMKILNPNTKANLKGTVDQYWWDLYEKLDHLVKLQLVICPDSNVHMNESLVSPYYKALKRMYELLSHGLSFDNLDSIKRTQVSQSTVNWVSGYPEKALDLIAKSVVVGDLHEWHDRIIVSVDIQYDATYLTELREFRAKAHELYVDFFKRWRSEKHKSFNDWFEEEVHGMKDGIVHSYQQYLERKRGIQSGKIKPTIDDLYVPFPATLVYTIGEAIKSVGAPNKQIWQIIAEYLDSTSFENLPFIKISCLLLAALARKAAAGKKRPPNQGMAYDISMISTLLPYCDAMFIDKECHSYLSEAPLCDAIDYGTKVFSLRNKREFLDFLDQILAQTPVEHLEKIEEVYGIRSTRPFMDLYT